MPFKSVRDQRVHPILVVLAVGFASFIGRPGPVWAQESLVEEDPDRRRILSILNDLEDLNPENHSRIAAAFDVAWELAVQSEDPLLNLSTDREQSLQPGTSQLDAGARYRLRQVFQNAPAAFRRIYRDQVKSDAEKAFQQAIQSSSIDELLTVIQRFQFTDIARQGLRQLVRLRRSRGEFLQAALQHGRWLSLQEQPPLDQQVLQIELLIQSGLDADAQDLFQDLIRDPDIDQTSFLQQLATTFGQTNSVPRKIVIDQGEELFAALTAAANRSAEASTEYAQPLGNARRSADLTAPSAAGLNRAWRQSTFSVLEAVDLNPGLQQLANLVRPNIALAFQAGQTISPIATPLLIGDQLIFRCAMNLRSVNLKTGEPQWETFVLDRHLSQVAEQAVNLNERGGVPRTALLNRTLQRPLQGAFWTLNNTAGQLTSDGRTIYAVEEVLDSTFNYESLVQLRVLTPPSNYLRAYDLKTGLLRSQAGGSVGDGNASGSANPLAGMYFLGAPLVLGDRIYVIAETETGIALVRLRATPLFGPADEFELQPVSSQLLSIPRFPLRSHPLRSKAGIVPSYGQGLIVCSTCDEHILAVSAEDHSVKWIYRYPTTVSMAELGTLNQGVIASAFNHRDSSDFDLTARWTDGLPRIVNGRIVVTPRDSNQLLCLDLQTGEEIWTMPRGNFRTVAVVDRDKVVVTGPGVVAAYRLQDGEPLWSTEVNDGQICGSGFSDGQTLHLPTSSPGVLSIRLQDGYQLLHQSTESVPGNLLSDGRAIYSQSIHSVERLEIPADSESPVVMAQSELLQGNFDAAIKLLQGVMDASQDSSQQQAASELFVDAISSRLQGNQPVDDSLIEKATQQLTKFQSPQQLGQSIVAQFFGIPPIGADFSWINDVTRAERRQAVLKQLLVRRSLQNPAEDPIIAAERMMDLLKEAWFHRDEVIQKSDLVVRRPRMVIQQIRKSISARGENTAALRDALQGRLEEMLESEPEQVKQTWWMSVCLMLDLPSPAADYLLKNTSLKIPVALADMVLQKWLEEQQSPQAAQQVIDYFIATDQRDRLTDLVRESKAYQLWQTPETVKEVPTSAVWFGADAVSDEQFAELLKTRPASDRVAFRGTPAVEISDAHSVTSARSMDRVGSVQEDLPVFDSNNEYRHWNFLVETTKELGALEPVLKAYDADGQLRFFHPLGRTVRSRLGYITSPTLNRYVVASGHLVMVYRESTVTMLDCSSASPTQPPTVLWSRPLRASPGNTSWERTTVYDRQPSGLKPAGPICAYGVPLISNGTLTVVDPLSGTEFWGTQSLPSDCSLTIRGDQLVLISQSTSQIETRSLIDGSPIKIRAIPGWWRDAEENSTTTPGYFELDESDSVPVRLQIFDGRCVLYRYGLKQVTVESYDLTTGQTTWSLSYPGESVVSSVCGGVVAVLSGGQTLQLIDITTGRTQPAIQVPAASQTLYLYLRRSLDHWLVFTDDFDQIHDDQNPASQSVIVNGYIHGIDIADGTLTWSQPIEHLWLRIRRPNSRQPPMPPVAPVLVMLKRPSPERDELGIRRGPTLYQATVFDTRTGEVLFKDKDVGYTLSNFFTAFRTKANEVFLNFDKRSVTFKYGAQNEE